MSSEGSPTRGLGGSVGHAPERSPADDAYRRAWWSLALYPVSFVAAFVIGEGLFAWLDDGVGDPAFWAVLLAASPALLVFIVPGLLAVMQGRKAMRLGRRDGRLPAIVGAAIGIAFVGQNLLAYAAQTIFD